MNKVMIDLETMGTASTSAIIALGAVRFDTEIREKFYEIIDLESCVKLGLTIDPSTVVWWMQQNEQARKEFTREGLVLPVALLRFSQWLGKDAEVWGNGSDFDNVILANAYKKCGIEQPWKFYNNRCYRTVKNMNRSVKMQRTGTYHRAIDDAKSQAKHLIRILETVE